MFSSQNSQVSADFNYIEDVFSTFLYTGNGSTQTITNNIDLAGKGGLVWVKRRDSTFSHNLVDTVRGDGNVLTTDTTDPQYALGRISLGSSGFNLTNNSSSTNFSSATYASWTFREQPKFFDIVTYTGTGVNNRTIPHNLSSIPGCMIVKSSTNVDNWQVYHRSISPINQNNIALNRTDGTSDGGQDQWGNGITVIPPTSTNFTVGVNNNQSGYNYVAYLFAHNAGGFGLTGTDNVVSCGSFTTDGTGAAGNITLGYEAQWVMLKRTDGVGGWNIIDTMRGSSLTSYNYLSPNTSSLESSSTSAGQGIFPTATGFFVGTNFPAASATYIYIAIRRGPMKVPTLGTSVFSPNASSASAGTALVTNFPVDLSISTLRSGDTRFVSDRLRGVNSPGGVANQPWIATDSAGAELTNASIPRGWDNTQILIPPYYGGASNIWWNFRRAPGFFDEVCYTGTGSLLTINHNLGVAPELVINKSRSAGFPWNVSFNFGVSTFDTLSLSTDAAKNTQTYGPGAVIYSSAPTSIVLNFATNAIINTNGQTQVSYLFATCAGVSKVGSYTGTGALQTIACGFTSGARFVLIKRTDSTGDWYVWDSARGITSGNDPYLLLNSTAAEVTSTNYVDTDSTGFKVTAAAPAALNASGGTYLFLAIA